MRKFEMTEDQRKALLLIAPKKDVRKYLCSIAIDHRGTRACFVVTDGHRLLALQATVNDDTNQHEPITAILPREVIASLKPDKSRVYVIELSDDGKRATIRTDATATTCETMHDYTYPDWRQAVPRKLSGEFRQLNADYLAEFAAICRLVNASRGCLPLVRYNGDGPAWIDLGNDAAVAIIMPMRTEPAEFYLPSWTGIVDLAVSTERADAA